jgi:hypothetical protein
LRIVWPLLAVVALLALLGALSIDILSAMRAYVAGEGLWSKAQKESVLPLVPLRRDARRGRYRRYQQSIAVPLGDRIGARRAREAASGARGRHAGFLEGRNHPDDIADMIWLFRRFRQRELHRQGDRNLGGRRSQHRES